MHSDNHRDPHQYPKLRALDILTVWQGDQRLLLIRDPLGLSEKQMLVSLAIAPLLGLMDGEHNLDEMTRLAASALDQPPAREQLVRLVDKLDELVMLENERYEAVYQSALDDFRHAAYRDPMLAGVNYPGEQCQCQEKFDCYLAEVEFSRPEFEPRGLISPHIDYERGWKVYASVWAAAKSAAERADLAIIFGTDHFGGVEPITLTNQSYSTPYGVLPTAREWVEQAADVLKDQAPFKGELRHRSEHSIELASVWLHHMRKGKPIKVIPILCSDLPGIESGKNGASESIEAFVQVLRKALDTERTLVVAAADLSHVGPAFGDPRFGRSGFEDIKQYDMQVMEHIERGNSNAFLRMIREDGNKSNICGASPIYLAMEALAPTQATRIAYQHCPADCNGTSIVTICGHLLP